MKKLFLLPAVLLGACATTYEEPVSVEQVVSASHSMSTIDILNKAKQVLLIEGYQIQSFDDSAGIISTALKNKRLTPAEADCGKTMGLDYLKDKRTKTEVAINIIAAGNSLTVKSNIQGEYKPGAASQDITLSCVSKGIVENAILNKILGT